MKETCVYFWTTLTLTLFLLRLRRDDLYRHLRCIARSAGFPLRPERILLAAYAADDLKRCLCAADRMEALRRCPDLSRSASCDFALQSSSRCSSGNLIASRQANFRDGIVVRTLSFLLSVAQFIIFSSEVIAKPYKLGRAGCPQPAAVA